LPKHLESLKEVSDLMPHVNQIELNPYNSRLETVHYCQSIGIAVQAYSPFGSGIFTKELLSDPVLIEIASRHEKSAAQIILRWMIQRGILVIPRSMKRSSLTEDIALFDFLLTQEEMDEVDKLNRDRFLEGDSRRVGVDGRYVPR
jgi:diketogulonate reductase-like aldo/keto reductase